MADIEVWYILINSDNTPFGEALPVIVRHNGKIVHLKKNIKEGDYEESFAHVNITEMEVWRCPSLTLCDLRPDGIPELVKNLTFSSDENSDGWELAGWDSVMELQLQEYEPLVVRVQPKAKRRRELEDDYLEGAKLSKLARLEPSKAIDTLTYENLQESQDERILDDCPKPDIDIPPLPLLYLGFGEFRDAFDNPSTNLPETRLMNEVDQLVDTTCNLGYEKGKQVNMQDHLQRIFSQDAPRESSYAVHNGSQATTNGYLLGSHGGPLLVIEYNRQITMAEPQLACYFLRLALKPIEDIFRHWRQPALGVLIRGTYISFHGLVMIDKQVRVLPLTPAFPCNDSELHNRTPLYVAFGAARHLLARIEQDAASLVNSSLPLPAIPGSCRRHPNIRNLLRVSGNNRQAGERINFQITDRFMTGLGGDHLLYLASTTDPDPQVILLKFSRQYSKDLHQFCTSIKHAPELLGFEMLPGGWFGVAMEYLPSAERILESKNLANHGEKWLEDIDNVVTAFHAQGYVHGDLRPPNFIVDGETLLLVDFDWGGMEMEATFPQARLHPILRKSRLEMKITKECDRRVMEYTKDEIRKKLEEQSRGGAGS